MGKAIVESGVTQDAQKVHELVDQSTNLSELSLLKDDKSSTSAGSTNVEEVSSSGGEISAAFKEIRELLTSYVFESCFIIVSFFLIQNVCSRMKSS